MRGLISFVNGSHVDNNLVSILRLDWKQSTKTAENRSVSLENREEGNGQKSIQLPNPFRPRHQRERRRHLKQQHHNQNITRRKPKEQFLSPKIRRTAIKDKKKNHQDIHAKTYNDRNSKPQQKHRLGMFIKITGGLKSTSVGHNPRP